jgi:hypothetical protein
LLSFLSSALQITVANWRERDGVKEVERERETWRETWRDGERENQRDIANYQESNPFSVGERM